MFGILNTLTVQEHVAISYTSMCNLLHNTSSVEISRMRVGMPRVCTLVLFIFKLNGFINLICILSFSLPKALCCCLQRCNIVGSEVLVSDIIICASINKFSF